MCACVKDKQQTVQQGVYTRFANMVTSYPLPEGFTEIEVFGIGTTLLVQGKMFFVHVSVSVTPFRTRHMT